MAVVETTVIEPAVTKIFQINPMAKTVRNPDADADADEPKTKKFKVDNKKEDEKRYGTPGTPFTPKIAPLPCQISRLCRGDAIRMPVSELTRLYEEQMNFRYFFVEDEEKKKWCIDLDMRSFKSCNKNEKVEQLVLALESKRDILTVQLIGDEDDLNI